MLDGDRIWEQIKCMWRRTGAHAWEVTVLVLHSPACSMHDQQTQTMQISCWKPSPVCPSISSPPLCVVFVPSTPCSQGKEVYESFKLREVKNGRLAMLAFMGFVAQYYATGKVRASEI